MERFINWARSEPVNQYEPVSKPVLDLVTEPVTELVRETITEPVIESITEIFIKYVIQKEPSLRKNFESSATRKKVVLQFLKKI